MRLLEYAKWKEMVEQTEEKEFCEECGGEGVLECDLGHEHDCSECDGEGQLGPDTTMRAYCEAVYNDLYAVMEWAGKVPGGYPDLPFSPYQRLDARSIIQFA